MFIAVCVPIKVTVNIHVCCTCFSLLCSRTLLCAAQCISKSSNKHRRRRPNQFLYWWEISLLRAQKENNCYCGRIGQFGLSAIFSSLKK